MSDHNGRFFPLGFAVASEENEDIWTRFLCNALNNYVVGLAKAFNEVHNAPFQPNFLMADADPSIRNAAANVWPNCQMLMCFFHVVKNVRKHIAGLNASSKWKVTNYFDY
jgi:hypothetical protein